MTSVLLIQAALAERIGERMPGYRVASAAGMSFKMFGRRAPDMVKRNQICREKLKGGAIGFFCYWMTEEQARIYRLKAALQNGSAGFSSGLVTDSNDIHDRLKFLRMLKEKTVFAEHAMLAMIIQDYERTFKLRRAAEHRVDMEEKRGNKPKQAGRRAVPVPLAEFNGWGGV
jgi:hypothetical protein